MKIAITFELDDEQRRNIKRNICELENIEYDGQAKATYEECHRLLKNEGYLGAERH